MRALRHLVLFVCLAAPATAATLTPFTFLQHFPESLVITPNGNIVTSGYCYSLQRACVDEMTPDGTLARRTLFGFVRRELFRALDGTIYAFNFGSDSGPNVWRYTGADLVFYATVPRLAALVDRGDGSLYGVSTSGYVGATYVPPQLWRVVPGGNAVWLADLAGATVEEVHDASADRDGNIYVPTQWTPGIVRIDRANHVSRIIELGTNTEPLAPIIAGDGMLYGATTTGGGVDGIGILYRSNPDGSAFAILKTFQAGTALGGCPLQLIDGSDGFIYGLMSFGASTSFGTVLRFSYGGGMLQNFADLPVGVSPMWIAREPSGGVLVAGGNAPSGISASGTLMRTAVDPRFPAFGTDRADVLLYSPTLGRAVREFATVTGYIDMTPFAWAQGWSITGADFNGDGARDLFLYNPQTGLFFKAINIGSGQYSFFGYRWAPGWTVTVTDFNGDGHSDVFLYNKTTGRWFQCLSVGDGTGDFDYVTGVWAPGWTVTKADWNGDGRGDLFLYNPENGQWFRVTTLPDRSFTYAGGTWARDWEIYPADFDGDGRTDLFLYSRVNGDNFAVMTTPGDFTYVHGVTWAKDWQIAVADLAGDGHSHLFLHNPANGRWFDVAITSGYEYQASGVWATGWQVTPLTTETGSKTPLLLYNGANGQWFRATPVAPGVFDFVTGFWPTSMTVVPLS